MKKNLYTFILIVILACILLAVPVSAVKSAESSVSDSLTRGGRFTVTIIAVPNSSYYIWLPHTSSMTNEPRDQPPVIGDFQTNVQEDPADGPWPIGSYQYSNGGGQTIRDDIPPSTADMPNTQYYALVTTDSRGLATVEFRTSVNTGLRSYSVRVESPSSVDSDTLQLELQVYSRRAPAIEIITPQETHVLTRVPTTTASPAVTTPPTTTPLVTTPEPLPPVATQATTTKASPSIAFAVLAVGMSLLVMKRH